MVFEALVSDLLNRFIGDYVENLDKSQLKIGIWGGNVVLENLRVKENALSEFDLPFKVKAGQIGTLTLKIPWKNLYNDAVVATLDGLYLLVVPGATIKYDAAKEERERQEAKQRELQRIEEALRMAARRASQSGELLFHLESVVDKETIQVAKGCKKDKKHKKALRKLKRDQHRKSEKPKEEKKDSFMEKLATQVIKNLQVKISSIHLRYEDDVSDPQRPLSMGVTLAELSLQTTDESWKLCILNEAAKIIHKLGRLECLCAYWNVNSQIFYRGSRQEIVNQLKSGIASKDQELPHYHYIFKPIFASAKIRINPDAEQELDSPKAQLHLEVQNIDIQITKPQYVTMVEMLEAVDRMVKNAPYRKFRPDVPVHANAAFWWRYAFSSILEVDIRRSSRMWSWSNMRRHRQQVKTYKAAYKSKVLSQNKLSPDTECQLQDLEKILDVFNITLARQQAHMEVVRSGQKVAAKKASGAHKQGGFFSGFFARKPKKEEHESEESEESEGSALDGIMTAEEKEKLYAAIGYSGSSHNLALPKQYVAVELNFQLLRTSVTIREQVHVPQILQVQMIHLSSKISQRPGAQALRVEAALRQWSVTGLDGGGGAPSLISSAGDSAASLLRAAFELNPDDSPADHLVRVHSQPVQIIYDAMTVNGVADFFKMGKGVELEVLTSATLSKLEEIKEKTATGLSHIIETRKVLDLKMDLRPSYLLLPKDGFYSDTSELIVVDFGNLQFNSVDENARSSSSSFSSLEEIMERAYERYSVELRRVQVLYSKSGDEWKSSRLQNSSGQHILRPLDLTLHVSKCMVDKDVRMPRLKLSGELPLVHVKMSDEKIRKVAELLRSIPLPRPPSASATPADKVPTLAESRPPALSLPPALLSVAETDSDGSEMSPEDEPQRCALEELTDLEFKFELKEVLLELTRQAEREKTVLALRVWQLGARGKMRTFDTSVTSYLRRIALDYCDVPDGGPLHLIGCSEQHHADLLKVDFIRADPSGPGFPTLFGNTEQSLKVEFSSLDFLLDAKALLSTMDFLSSAVTSQLPSERSADARKPLDKDRGGTASKGVKDAEVVSLKLSAVLGCFHVELCDDRRSIADIRVQGMDASVLVRAKQTEVFARLRDIVVTDVDPECLHKKAVSIVGEEVFSFQLRLFPGATEGDGYKDTSKADAEVTLRLGCIRVVYLHRFLMSLLMFADNFHTAKEAVSAATAQAAEKAASGVRHLAHKSFRLLMDVRLKAPLIVVPQSSGSRDAVLVDLGLITVSNSFGLVSAQGFSLPAVVDKMDVRLTQLKLSRTTLREDSSSAPDIEILEPINVELAVTRNTASSWFAKIPGVHVQGVLRSLKVSAGEEDLAVLSKVLLENIGEGSREHRHAAEARRGAPEKLELGERRAALTPSGRTGGGAVEAVANGEPEDNPVNVLLNFEITEVLLSLKKPKREPDGRPETEGPFLVFHLGHLGMHTKVRKYDTCATTYISQMTLTSLEFKDSAGDPLRLVSSSARPGSELLKVQYFKADREGPNFSSAYKNTEQMINVTFSSLDLTLHTQALLSTANFLSGALSSGSAMASPERTLGPKAEDGKMTAAKSDTTASSELGEIISLKVMVALGAFNVLVCDQSSNIVHIKIQGLHGSLLVQGPQTHMSARLKDFAVLNVDPASIHKKAISIVGDEVFSFSVSLTPEATEGSGYADTSKTDGRVKLNVGCVRVVYLHKLVMALLNFANNFQTAKAAVSAATAQAAERAASGVRDLAQKSFRLSTDIKLKAPLIVIPQSSASYRALVMDLGLITVSNSFDLLPIDGCPLPAVIDNMDVQLTQLKLSRNCLDPASGGASSELLEPVNLKLRVSRNLAASWYNKMAAVEVDGDLKPMKVALSQEDLTVLLKILTENMAEADSLRPSDPRPGTASQLRVPAGPQPGVAGKQIILDEDRDESVESIKFNFRIESLGLVLYKDEPEQSSDRENSRLGEFALHLLKASGKLWNNGSMEFGTILTNCTLDDRRSGMDRVTSRMVSRQDSESSEAMIDVVYRQSGAERSVVAVLHKLYVCASVEFLMAVADFFLRALPRRPPQNIGAAPSDRLPLRPAAEPRSEAETVLRTRTSVRAVIVDPQVVFVASLMKADAPSLLVSFQCDFNLQEQAGIQTATAQLRALKVLACPLIRNKEDETATTVLRPCSVVMETRQGPSQPLSGSVTVEEVVVKISPFILNTVSTIMAAMTAGQGDRDKTGDQREALEDLWLTKKVYACNYWFLGVDQASEITENFREQQDLNVGQHFAAHVKLFQVTLESGLGHRTVPLLLAESSFSGSAKNWSSLLQLKANMTLEVNYFNEVHAAWEPLIERLDGGARRWNLDLEMKTNPAQDMSPVHGDDFVILPEPRVAVNICSGDALNVTLSRCGLDVFSNLAKAFSEGAASTFEPSMKEKAPFTILNALGIPLIVQHSANLRPAGAAQHGRLHELPAGRSMDLEHSVLEASSRGKLSALQRQESCLFHLTIVPAGYSEIAGVPVDRPGRRLYNIRGPELQQAVSLVVQVDAADGNALVTVRSPLQIHNHFSVPFSVLKFCPSARALRPVGLAQPEKEFHIPLDAYRCQLYVCPASDLSLEYGPSSTCVSWKEEVHRSSEVRSLLQCPPLDGGGGVLPLMVSTLATPDALNHIASRGEDDWDPAYVLHLHPVATLRNLLPYTLRYMMENCANSYELPEGSTSDLLNARLCGEILSLVLLRYQGRDWHGHLRVDRNMPEFLVVCLTCDSDAAATLDLSVHAAPAPGRLLLSLFSPFWIINKTRRVLQYRAEDVGLKHPADLRDIVLFSFRRKNILGKNKLQLCVSTSSWSDGFSLDTVGSCGCVRCPGKNKSDFLVGVSIRMSSFALTKMVTMSPFYTLVNKSSYELEVGEPVGAAATKWHYVPSAECLPLWPESTSGKLCVRAVGSERASRFFFFDRQDNGTLLNVDTVGRCGGITVDVNVSDHASIIGFGDYYEGAAPALLINHTPWADISYKQSGCSEVHRLKPGEARRFAWDDPAGVRTLSWSCSERSGETDLLKDEVGQFPYDGLSEVHWVSFLDGRQRVLIFTEDVAVVTKARQAEELEQYQLEVRVSLRNLGLSLVDNAGRQEVAYVGVPSSGVVWEMKRKNRWKPLSRKHIDLLEKTYQSLQSGQLPATWTKVDANLEVNLGAAVMMMRRPFSCPLRRNFLSGIQVELKRSRHQRSLRAQLHWLQVDNQLPGAIFPIAFHPVPPPKSIALDSEPKPFIDVSVITRFNRHSGVTQFKYFMALVQEMAVKIDQGFLSAILALVTPAADPRAAGQKTQLIQKDVELLQAELMESSLSDASGLNFFEHFHISPIKLHLSLSLGSSGDHSGQDAAAAVQSLNLLLKSIGATLTDVDDLVFKLAYFEVKYRFYRREKLMRTALRHYSEQFLKQMYVLVLGLDVLGNPFGLIRGLSEGVEAFFYEPFQGAVQGPEEFAEGFVIGVRSLLGHTVGGAAGVVSRITGSVGKGLAAITMDKEYQQKRREEMNRTPKDFGGSLAKGGKGLLKGVVGGVTGIVTKPVEGAMKEGAAGFFKGIGKGLVGAVARPTGSIVDMASSTFQGIQRAAESTEDVSKLRPVRLIREDGIIRPYDLGESQGFELFQRCELKRLEGEVFRDQCPYPGHRKTNIIVTNRRVVCVKEMDFVGHFNKDWECLFENFCSAPNVSGTRLNISCKEHHKLKLPKKDPQPSTRSIDLNDANTAQRMLASILDAQADHRQRRMSRQKSQRFLKATTGEP
ncbi:intermembrane lipid transfer protein VPS13C isoform X3 [Hippocampus zosterae]|uniref:intermembrane lipid transfer protein VPS13C isoform X3 n=1 Tax=Hippocampus zosterae TaxID=109293 RepID=UPI00223DE801|nr:intermembrane lipid transfer protein VPS13C isoform X3 [Hippocampus zosterae]